MARKFETPRASYILEDGYVQTDKSIQNKITGTAFGAVLGHNPYQSPFEAACRLLGLIREDIGDKPAVRAGRILEVPIIHYLGSKYDGEFYPDEDLDICRPREGDHDTWPSDWEDPIFAGHIDGVRVLEKETYILEIKTARDMNGWTDGVPQHYKDQVRLYNWFLTQQTHAYVGMGIVTEDDYRNPQDWMPGMENVVLFDVDLDLFEDGEAINYARDWYNTYIEQGVTPPMDPTNPRDVEIWEFLASVAAPADDVMEAIDELAKLEGEIKAHDLAIKETKDRAEALKKSIKEHMTKNGIENMESASGTMLASISTMERVSYDTEAMINDGIDPKKYQKITTSNVFKIKKSR